MSSTQPPPSKQIRVEVVNGISETRPAAKRTTTISIQNQIAQGPLQFQKQLYRTRNKNEGIFQYYRELTKGCAEEIKVFPVAAVSMKGGTIHDVFLDHIDYFLCLAYSLQHKTASGMCTRPRKRPNGTTLYPLFFDLDVYSSKRCCPEDIQFMMREFLFPTMATFFDDTHHKEAMSKTHFAAYFSQFPDSDEIARQKKSKLLCGLCEKGRLYRSMEGLKCYAECKACGVRFLCSSLHGGVETISVEPFMFSKDHFIKAHRHRMPFAETHSMNEVEPWTLVEDHHWDSDTRTLTFQHGVMEIQTKLRFIETHVDKTAYKYGVHLKALNVEWLFKQRRYNSGRRRILDSDNEKLKR